jgi:hypothetical protein
MGDLLLNLVSEGIGIAVTVLLIDRIIKYRGERSWRPAKRVIHRRVLTGIIDPFLDSSSALVQDVANSEYWNRFGSDIEAAVELRGATRRVAGDAKNKIRDEFDSSGPLFGSELSNLLQTLDEQLGNVLKEEREVKARLDTQHPRSQAQVLAALEPLAVRIREAAGAARQTKSWVQTDLNRPP